ncbi:MAG: hypothetical protein LBU46_07900, partial [Candidatus Accumulibacter sp.]|nr:hypothetical protein [Accumulibacter sp.]
MKEIILPPSVYRLSNLTVQQSTVYRASPANQYIRTGQSYFTFGARAGHRVNGVVVGAVVIAVPKKFSGVAAPQIFSSPDSGLPWKPNE